MKISEYCKRSVITIGPKGGLADAAKLMRDHHIGFLVVVEEKGGGQIPVGVLTDRDLVIQVIAAAVDPATLTVTDVMTSRPILASENDDFGELLQGMRTAGVRRAPVVDVSGRLTGIIAIDDALDVVTGLMCDICGVVRNEQRMERRLRPA